MPNDKEMTPDGGAPLGATTSALRMRTPIPGLYLSGQDVVTPGIFGAMWGGALAAASIDPHIFQHLRSIAP